MSQNFSREVCIIENASCFINSPELSRKERLAQAFTRVPRVKRCKTGVSFLHTEIPIAFSEIDNKLPITVSTLTPHTHARAHTHTRASSKGLRAVNEQTRVHRST